MATYSSSSPWYNTRIVNNQYLDLLNIRSVPQSNDDVRYVIEPQYNYRPDLLAYDLYGDHKLWWVFAQRNLDSLKDPVYDFEAGTEIYLPQGSALSELLGL
jgi:hypothetical protein